MFSLPPWLTRRAPVLAGLVTLAVVAAVVVLVVGTDRDEPRGTPTAGGTSQPTATPAPPLSTPLADVDTTTLPVQRAAFCELLDPDTVEAAVGGAPVDVRSYGNGESARLSAEVTDIAHEHGCRWKRGRTTARAWVFAPPVTPRDANRLARDARSGEGCDVRRGAPAYGAASVARTCAGGDGGQAVEASYRGLFGDAWLACSLTMPGEASAVLERAGAWCLEVAEAAAQPPA